VGQERRPSDVPNRRCRKIAAGGRGSGRFAYAQKVPEVVEKFSMKWAHHPNLRKRPRTPAKVRGSVQRAIRRAFAASGTEALTSSAIYDWAHIRRRLGRRKSMPFGIYSRTLRTLRAMCDPIERVPPHGAWLWRLRNTADNNRCVEKPSQKRVS